MDNIVAEFGNIAFDMPKTQSNIIKVIGVGGGGGNAVNYMYKQGIKGVDYVISNTDAQALEKSPILNKIQLGLTLTEGGGAGADPEVGEKAAIESISEIEAMLGNNTKMVFITAGMGGGTGTGAAPIIAKICKEKGILTVAIVTTPFKFEGKPRYEQAQKGIEKIRQYVDSLIVINNNKLRDIYGNLSLKTCFAKVDEVLTIAAKGIAEVITQHFSVNIDLRDAKTVLSNSGTAIMGSARARGEGRALKAIMGALDSPLLNDSKITGAKNVLLLIVSGKEEITMDETDEINEFIQREANSNYQTNIIMGVGEDESLEDEILVTVIATGFNTELQYEALDLEQKKVVYTLGEEEQRFEQELDTTSSFTDISFENIKKQTQTTTNSVLEQTIFSLEDDDFKDETGFPTNVVTAPVIEKPQTTITRPKIQPQKAVQPPATMRSDDFQERIKANPLYNTPVKFEVISPLVQETKEDDIIIYSKKDVKEPVAPKKIEQIEAKEEVVVIDLFSVADLVEQPVENKELQVVINETGQICHNLEDYLQVEDTLTKAVAPEKKATKSVAPELVFEKIELPVPSDSVATPEISAPMLDNIHINKLRANAENRRKTFKAFNHSFNQSAKAFREMEDIPAYKRQGVELGYVSKNTSELSTLSLNIDSNGMLQMRQNNAFLHDNPD